MVDPTRLDELKKLAAKTQFQITITFNAMKGNVTVDGPMDNPVLFHGMMAMATEVAQDFRRANMPQREEAKATDSLKVVQ